MNRKYKHLIFDLDRTLWDFERASRETFAEIYELYILPLAKVPFDDFFSVYRQINEFLWEQYRNKQIAKEVLRTKRFGMTLDHFGLEFKANAVQIADYYIANISHKAYLFEGSAETLKVLASKYTLSVMTNGFKEVQYPKLERSGISHLFSHVFVSEEIGINKPNPGIFHFALKELSGTPEESIMIGDDFEVDIAGAVNCGMNAIWFKPDGKKDKDYCVLPGVKVINSIPELLTIL